MATREAELFKDKVEVTLDGRQIFYLFFGGAVIACLVFILGVTVGRRVEARSNPVSAGAAHDPLAALDELDAEASGGELAFPAALRGEVDRPLGAVDERLARGGGAKKVVEPTALAAAPVAPAPVAPAPEAAAVKPAEVEEPAEPEADDAPPVAIGEAAKKPADKAIVAPAADKALAVAAKKPEPAAVKADKPVGGPGKFTLQLSSFQDKVEAEAFLQRMKQAGYTPYMMLAEVEGKGRWFRIRVGDYQTFQDAVAAKADFESKQKVIAYVTRK
jgi:DedD protein